MAGSTATIDLRTLRIQWDSHSSMAAICSFWTITKDQLVRLKGVVPLAPRHDRRLRYKPKRSEYRDPTPEEIRLGCIEIQARWDARTREERAVTKRQAVQLRRIETSDDVWVAFDEPPADD